MDGWSGYTWDLAFPRSFASNLLIRVLVVSMSVELLPFLKLAFAAGGILKISGWIEGIY